MTENSYQQMAQQFIELWQQQLAQLLMDERFVGSLVDAMQTSQPFGVPMSGAQPFGGMPNQPFGGMPGFTPGGFAYANPAATAAPQPADTSVPPHPAGDALVELQRRLVASEARIRELEAELAELHRRLANDAPTTAARPRSPRNSGKNRTRTKNPEAG